MIKLPLLLTALVLVAGSALAADPAPPVPIQNLVNEGAQIRYLGRDQGLDAWLTIKNGREQYFYVTPDGQGIVMGVLFNPKGDMVTMQQVEKLREKEGSAIDKLAGQPDLPSAKADEQPAANAPQPEAQAEIPAVAPKESKADRLFEAVSAANTISLGKEGAPEIFTFIDPECPHCHDMIKAVRKDGALEKGEINIRLIPVGLMNDKALKEAAWLLAAPDARQAFFNHLDGKKGAIPLQENINTQGVQRNMALMQEWKIQVTPFSVYKDAKGKIKVIQGVPKDLKTLKADLKA